ncbi:MAG TPA: 2-hydroxychromene-2-carboxylate isomerase [Stellaceae bacterium]
MADKIIDYYFTPVSPWTYLGHERFGAIAKRHGAAIHCKPVDFGKIFPASGGLPLAKRAPQRQAYRLVELERWRKFLGVALNLHPKFFPASADLASRLILASPAAAQFRLAGALQRAVWAEERNIADPATLRAIADACGLDGAETVTAAEAPEAASRCEALTQEALQRQVFGAPTYVFRDEPFWGQDRLDFLDRALGA